MGDEDPSIPFRAMGKGFGSRCRARYIGSRQLVSPAPLVLLAAYLTGIERSHLKSPFASLLPNPIHLHPPMTR